MDQLTLVQKWEIEFKKGFAKPLIMLILAQGKNYPYNIAKTIFNLSQGQLSIATSNIYPILKDLKDQGLINEEKNPESRRIMYELTDLGIDFLNTILQSLTQFIYILLSIIEKKDGLPL